MGRGKAFDPSRFFIFCANVMGSPYGSFSPVRPFQLVELLIRRPTDDLGLAFCRSPRIPRRTNRGDPSVR